MRSFVVLPALVAVASAQAQSFSFATSEPATSADNIEPTATETASGPIDTARACEQVSGLVGRSRLEYPSIEAELAYACLKSVPIIEGAAELTINSLKQMVQFQSTLTYLKDPPKGYANDGVDILGGLDDIGKKVSNGDYDNEYDFENDIAELLVKAHDGHLSFEGMAYGGAFRWRRSRQVSLISASKDGKEAPKVWAIQDFNNTGGGFEPSAVSKIDGKNAAQYLQEESELNSYHDPDTRYNAMFYMPPAESYGYFTNPRFYPGPSMTLTFENGTEHEYINAAVVLDSSAWSYVEDGETFYETFVQLSTSSQRLKKRNPSSVPRHLQHVKDAGLDHGYVPEQYPEPDIEHSASDVPLAGFFLDTSVGTVGVLMIQTFNTESTEDAVEFQEIVEEYINEAKDRGAKKHIIDVRTNGGGKILLGYDTYLQFFPSQEPQLMSRYRGHESTELIGEQISTLPFNSQTGELFTSPYNYHAYLDKDNKAYDSWDDMYGPAEFNNDKFTNLLRYNLSDPLTTSSDRFSIGVTMTGYGDRSDIKEDPFKKEDIIILSDGICASTCSLFTELMVQQSGVRTLAIGGRPSLGPMQAVGGTKGSLVLQAEYLTSLSAFVVQNFAESQSEARKWASFLPNSFGINNNDATVNFQDNIRKGLEKGGIPTQFLNDTASCRIWYEAQDYLNATAVWVKAAEVAFGNDGKLDEDRCVTGSVTSDEQQNGQGEANPTNAEGTAKPTKSKGAAAGSFMLKGQQSSWNSILVCAAVVLGSVGFGASLI